MKTTILKPGILVGLKTRRDGGVRYKRVDIAPETFGENAFTAGGQVDAWETLRTIDEPAEYAESRKVRNAASGLIRKCCALTSFGLLCAEDREAELDVAIEAARTLVDAFNARAKSTRVSLYVLRGRIAKSDEEAARAIASEVTELLEQMKAGIAQADVKAIRDAADRARQIGAVLDAAQADAVGAAVEQARKAARDIVRRVGKDGEERAAVVATLKTDELERARFAFLDFEVADRMANGQPLPAIELKRVAELDLDAAESV